MDDAIIRTASEVLDVLEQPIAGVPSVRVLNRDNAIRLLAAAMEEVWKRREGGAP